MESRRDHRLRGVNLTEGRERGRRFRRRVWLLLILFAAALGGLWYMAWRLEESEMPYLPARFRESLPAANRKALQPLLKEKEKIMLVRIVDQNDTFILNQCRVRGDTSRYYLVGLKYRTQAGKADFDLPVPPVVLAAPETIPVYLIDSAKNQMGWPVYFEVN